MLVELQLQMTKATFDTWVKPTAALKLSDDVLTIGVRNAYALQWLDTKLRGMVERTANHAYGKPLEIKFVQRLPSQIETPSDAENEDDLKLDDVIVELIESPLKPFIFVQKYALWFWQPLIGSVAFSTWLMLRTLDRLNEGRGKKHRLSVDMIAQTLGCHRQTLTGRHPAELLEGTFGTLNAEKLALISTIGEGKDTIYYARVLNAVPLLTPEQVKKLSPLLCDRHNGFLKEFSVDADTWEQLEIATLVRE